MTVSPASAAIRADLAHALVVAATRRGMTISGLARASGMSRAALYALMDSARAPSVSMLERFAAAMHCRLVLALAPIDTASPPMPRVRATPADLIQLRSQPHGIDVCHQATRIHPPFADLIPPWPTDAAVREACVHHQRFPARAAAHLRVPLPWLRARAEALGIRFATSLRPRSPRQPLTDADIAAMRAAAEQLEPLHEIAARYNRSRERIRQILGRTTGSRYAERAARARARLTAHVRDLLRTTTDIDAVMQQAAAASPLSRQVVRATVRRIARTLIQRRTRAQRTDLARQHHAVGTRLRHIMAVRGMTSVVLAQAVGVSDGLISHLRQGRTGSRYLPALAAQLGVSFDWLARGIGTMDARDAAASPAPALPSPSPPPVPNA